MINDINKHISLVEESIAWANKFGKSSFPIETFKEYRRQLKKIRLALDEKCSAAAYGESQVGKSYLMSSLLSSPDSPFMIDSGDRSYSFIDELNPSGGNNAKIESTGIITRFTMASSEDKVLSNMVKIRNLSVVDLILMIADSYYNDIKIDPDSSLTYDVINKEIESLAHLWNTKEVRQTEIEEDDIKDICEYIKEVIGNNASSIYQSNFMNIIAPVIAYISDDNWVDVFSLLWNKNAEMSHLFSTLIKAYKKIDYLTEVYVPFDAVLREKGTLLKIDWLDSVCGVTLDHGDDEIYTDIYNQKGDIVAHDFPKGNLSALIAELILSLPKELVRDRKFLDKIDLLDFPGARSREKYREQEIQSVLPKILRRGKVAYLFNKYSRSLRISSVLFCHHNDQKSEPTIGDTVNTWIEQNIGHTPQERAKMLSNTSGIAPLFMIATKFNIDLERIKTDTSENVEKLDSHWNRFDTVFPEIIKPNTWFDEWVSEGGLFSSKYFQNIYPLRDFYWSGKNNLFDGYSDVGDGSVETAVHVHADYPEYFENLKSSFIHHPFVVNHFSDPEAAWNDVATVNNDGSKGIIRSLDKIAGVLNDARKQKYLEQLNHLKESLYKNLIVYFEPEDIELKNEKVKNISGDIRRSLYLSVASKPEIFGKIIDRMMIHVGELRNIAYDIIVCHSEVPKDFSEITFLRKMIGIDLSDSKEANLEKLSAWGRCSIDQIENEFAKKGFTIEDVIINSDDTLTTVGEIVTKRMIDYWKNYLNNQVAYLETFLPHADEVVFMLINLFDKLNLKERIIEKIEKYSTLFDEEGLPNVIADYTSLTLNNFVSSIGREYLEDSDLNHIRQKSEDCGLKIDLSNKGCEIERKPQSLIDTLSAFDDSSDLESVSFDLLRKLPLWDSFQRWENLMTIGLLYVSDISHSNPEANTQIKSLISLSEELYN